MLFKKIYVGNNSVIKNSIILNNAYIGDNAYIENCIVESNSTIKANSRYVGGEWYKDCCGGQPFVLLRIKVATEGFQTKV